MENPTEKVETTGTFNLPGPIEYNVRIGVTGHRNLADEVLAGQAVENVLGRIKGILEKGSADPCQDLVQGRTRWDRLELWVARQSRRAAVSFYSTARKEKINLPTALEWSVVSSLALGADRIVARKAMELLDARPHYILPFLATDYSEDFATEEEKNEFTAFLNNASYTPLFDFEEKPAPADRAEGYLRAGEKMVEACEILIAVWNGKAAAGKGGTAEIVEYATQLNRKVIWIDSENLSSPVRLVHRIDRSSNDFRVVTRPFPETAVGLSPTFVHLAEYNRDPEFREEEYRATLEKNRVRLERARESAGLSPEIMLPVLDHLLPHYAKSDSLANRYKVIHDRAAAWLYRLTVVAVGTAALQAILAPEHTRWLIIELSALLGAFLWFRWGRIRNWHEKWLNNRHLAERLRILTFSALILKKPVGKGHNPEERLPFYPGPGAWALEVFDHIRRTMSQPEYDPGDLEPIRRFVLAGWILHQEEFHAKSSRSKHRKAHAEHRWIGILLALTLTAATVHMLGIAGNPLAEKLVTSLAIILPALASAIHAISAVRDRERIATRYSRMAEILNRLKRSIGEAPDLETLYEEMQKAEEIMSTENHEWCVSLGFRKVSSPPV